MRGRSMPGLAVGLCLALVVTGCSSKNKKQVTRPPQNLSATSAYEKAIVDDGATALWSFRDATNLSAQDEVSDLTANKSVGTVVGGTIARTTSANGGVAAQFLRSGRVVTTVTNGLASGDSFSLELDLRHDICTSAWGRVLGTTSLPKSGREGFELLHFPKQFSRTPCRFGVEFWHLNHFLGGCSPAKAPVVGVWNHWAIVYSANTVSCYVNGTLFAHTSFGAGKTFLQLGPLGIGGSGSGFQGPLDGASVAEVAFYRRALTSAEVAQHAALSRATAPSGTPTAGATARATAGSTVGATHS